MITFCECGASGSPAAKAISLMASSLPTFLGWLQALWQSRYSYLDDVLHRGTVPTHQRQSFVGIHPTLSSEVTWQHIKEAARDDLDSLWYVSCGVS